MTGSDAGAAPAGGVAERYRRLLGWIDRHAARIVRAAAVIALLLGALLSIGLGSTLRFDDERVYSAIADNLAHGRGFSEDGSHATAYQPPGYPLLLGVLRLVHVPTVGLRFAGTLLLVGGLLCAAALARELFGRAAGAVTAVVIAGYPPLAYTAANLYPQALAMLELTGGLLAAVLAARAEAGRHRTRLAVLCGLAFGALAITVPTYAVIYPVVLIWLFRRAAVRTVAALALIASLLIPVTWTVRNAMTFHALVPVSTNSGLNLVIGNSPRTTPTSGVEIYENPVPGPKTGVGIERKRDAVARKQATDWIADHPRQAGWLYLGKYLNHFNYRNSYATGGASAALQDGVTAIVFLPLLALFLARLVQAGRRRYPFRPFEPVLVAVVLGVPVALAVFFTRLRFRMPLDAELIVVVAGLLTLPLRRPTARPEGSVAVPQSAGEFPLDVAGGAPAPSADSAR